MELSVHAIWLATAALDMRTGDDGLSLHVQQALGRAPCDVTVYVFANRRRTRLELVCWDGTGVWMCLRRLHRGQFVWPQTDEASWQMYTRVRFGKVSEALVGEQRKWFDEAVDMNLAAIEEELAVQAPAKRQRKRAGRQSLSDHLERIQHRHEPASCQCGADLVKIGKDVSEQLDVDPARLFVHRHIRAQYACRPCETVTVAWPLSGCWAGSAFACIWTTCHCTGSSKSPRAKVCRWRAPR